MTSDTFEKLNLDHSLYVYSFLFEKRIVIFIHEEKKLLSAYVIWSSRRSNGLDLYKKTHDSKVQPNNGLDLYKENLNWSWSHKVLKMSTPIYQTVVYGLIYLENI